MTMDNWIKLLVFLSVLNYLSARITTPRILVFGYSCNDLAAIVALMSAGILAIIGIFKYVKNLSRKK